MTPRNQDIAGTQPWCIAGGYAACPQLAGDMDVWIFGYHKDVLENVRAGLLMLHENIIPEDNPKRDDPEAYFGASYTLKVGRLPGKSLYGVKTPDRHILVTAAPDIEALIAGFDLSTHQCAISSDGTFIKGDRWTPIWEPPRILLDGGANTPLRYKKLYERYQFLYLPKGLNHAA